MSDPLYTQYNGHNSTTFVVSNSAELKAAMQGLSGGDGGTILLDGDGGPYDLQMSEFGGSDTPILVTSVDPNNPAVFTSLNLSEASHVTFDNLSFDHSSLGGEFGTSDFDIRVSNSDHIEFTNNVMTGSANGMATYEDSSIHGGNLARIDDSSDILFAGNTISEYFHGVAIFDSQQITFTQNEVTAMQGDGFRGGGIEGGVITDNYFHDFYGAFHEITHNDMIQLWGTNVSTENKQILIDGNFLDSGEGTATQGIFIRNETFGNNGPASGYFEDITITNNTIYNGRSHGINLSDTIGGVVQNNTVLWNQDSGFFRDENGEFRSFGPWINGDNTLNSDFSDNVARRVILNGEDQDHNNLALEYSNASSSDYVNNHFDNPNLGGSASFDDIQLSSDSAYYGVYGANTDAPTPPQNSTSTSISAEETAPAKAVSAVSSSEGETSTGFEMGGENQHVFGRDDYDMFGLDEFEMAVRFRIDELDDAAGTVLRLAGSFSINTYPHGGFKFRLVTEDGVFEIFTPTNTLSDGEFHDILVNYDGAAGLLRLSVDGELVEEITATGATSSDPNSDLILGNSFGSTAQGNIDSFYLNTPDGGRQPALFADDANADPSAATDDAAQQEPQLGTTEFSPLTEDKISEINVVHQSSSEPTSSTETEPSWKVNGFLGSNYDTVLTKSSAFSTSSVFAEAPSVSVLPFTAFGDELPWVLKNWLLNATGRGEFDVDSDAASEDATVSAEFEAPISSSPTLKLWSDAVDSIDNGDAIWGYLSDIGSNQPLADSLNLTPVEDYDSFIM